MAKYIALNYNTFFEEQNASQSDFSSITSPNSNSYALILTSSTPWTIGGDRYMVYQIAALSDGSTIDETWFIHSYGGNIGSIDDLPLNSKIVYATSNTGTFSGNGFSTGTLYYSSKYILFFKFFKPAFQTLKGNILKIFYFCGDSIATPFIKVVGV